MPLPACERATAIDKKLANDANAARLMAQMPPAAQQWFTMLHGNRPKLRAVMESNLSIMKQAKVGLMNTPATKFVKHVGSMTEDT